MIPRDAAWNLNPASLLAAWKLLHRLLFQRRTGKRRLSAVSFFLVAGKKGLGTVLEPFTMETACVKVCAQAIGRSSKTTTSPGRQEELFKQHLSYPDRLLGSLIILLELAK